MSQFLFKLARKIDSLQKLQDNIGHYIHFSDSDRFGISYHKNVHPGNPRALYGFLLTSDKFQALKDNRSVGSWDDFKHTKYIYIFSVNGSILNLENYDLNSIMNEVKKIILSKYTLSSLYSNYIKSFLLPSSYGQLGILGFIHDVFNVLQNNQLAHSEHSFLNSIFREIGYDAIETNNYGFQDGISGQIAVLNPLSINLIAKIDNPI